MSENEADPLPPARLGLDMGVYAAKGVLLEGNEIKRAQFPTAGRPVEAAQKCIDALMAGRMNSGKVALGITGQNARLVAETLSMKRILEIEALQAGLAFQGVKADFVLSLGHENMLYLELDEEGTISFFSRNGQCAAGSGSFWYQQATRMGYDDRRLAEIALEAESFVPISGRCAVFAKSDMTHAINEGATQSTVAAGMAQALVENVVTSVAQNRINGPGTLAALGGVANNRAVFKHLAEYGLRAGVKVSAPPDHEYITAIGAAVKGTAIGKGTFAAEQMKTPAFKPENPLPPLDPAQVTYLQDQPNQAILDLSRIYLGIDCGSVSTKCVLLDRNGLKIGGVYLPTTGRPALQVLELMKQVDAIYGKKIDDGTIVACTTGSGRFLSQKILNAEYAVDEITCQAEGIKYLFPGESSLSIIEIGGEDSKFIQLRDGVLFDYNMNPVCAAGTGTFLENLAELLGISIEEEFSERAFSAGYAVDLGDICTLISQSILASASARGLPLDEQLASLAYSSAQNYLSKTVDKRPISGKLIFAGATAKNHALAGALAARCEQNIYIPPEPELTGALGSALMARHFDRLNKKSDYSFRSLNSTRVFKISKDPCRAECRHEHNCTLSVISFPDNTKFIYGDRCGRYSALEKQRERQHLPDYSRARLAIMEKSAGTNKENGPLIGIARCGLYFDFYPFWAAFFRELGCRTIRSGETTAETLQEGKVKLDSEMCYPMKAILGHYAELKSLETDYIFIPEVIDMETLPWARQWPRSFTCPLLQTLQKTVVNSLGFDVQKTLYARLNYRSGFQGIRDGLRATAKKIMGPSYSERNLVKAVEAAFAAQDRFKADTASFMEKVLNELKKDPEQAAVVFLSRSYTLYDSFVSKKSMHYASRSGMIAIPHEFFLVYLQTWYQAESESALLDPYREELKTYMEEQAGNLENVYPAQLQRIISTVLLINFLNQRRDQTGLPRFNLVLLDPFKCGPNAMLRHFLKGMATYLRLTLDEHTAAAGMITRLEAFKNTCLTNETGDKKATIKAVPCSLSDNHWKKLLIPAPTRQADVIASILRRKGIEAVKLPRSDHGDLSLAQKYVNGDECLPFIQNLQDYLYYLQENDQKNEDGTVFFQGWACGPCRYGLYAPLQALALFRAGYDERKICAVKLADFARRCGFAAVVGIYNALLAMDLLYKMLHRVRPYELEHGSADALFEIYADKLVALLGEHDFSMTALPSGSYRKPLETLIRSAAAEFGRIARKTEQKPLIIVGGEFYVRLDDRCNQSVIKKIEQSGGEACLAPMTEVFTYTILIDCLEARQAFKLHRRPADFLLQAFYSLLLKISHRDEKALEKAAMPLLSSLEEPAPEEIMARAARYVSSHYGGEPPMTIGRTAALSAAAGAGGAVFVAPFTCMPGSIVEAQQRLLQEELGIPVVTIYYDGRENANRDELVEGLVFQAGQKLSARGKG